MLELPIVFTSTNQPKRQPKRKKVPKGPLQHSPLFVFATLMREADIDNAKSVAKGGELRTSSEDAPPIVLTPNPGPQTSFVNSEADITIFGGAAGGGKMLPLITPLPTPTGWTTMGDLKLGDELFDKDGKPCRVLALSAIDPSPELWRFEFDDGSTIESCVDHRWLVSLGGRRSAVATTREIVADLASGSVHDRPSIEAHDGLRIRASQRGRVRGLRKLARKIADCEPRPVRPWLSPMVECGTGSDRPLIPPPILRATEHSRLRLLTELLSEFREIGAAGTAAGIEWIETVSEVLAEQFYELVISLGWPCFVRAGRKVISGINRGPSWRVEFQTKQKWRYVILEAKKVPSRPGRCIEVDSPSSTFLCGKQMIPTHNSHGLFLAALKQAHLRGYRAVIFRRTGAQIRMPGGLWDASMRMMPDVGGTPSLSLTSWTFAGGDSEIRFSHLEHETDKLSWLGAELGYIGFDELPSFTEGQFWYLISRLRSVRKAIRPRLGATCNPDPDSFVAKLISWWIGADGFAIPDRAGKTRWFVRDGDALVWANSVDEMKEKFPKRRPMSLTFIPSALEDNPFTMENDPLYAERLESLPSVERERLRRGNWHIRAAAGVVFNRDWIRSQEKIPDSVEITSKVRYWDKAGSLGHGDRTASVLMYSGSDGKFYVVDAIAFREEAMERNKLIYQTAERDGYDVAVWTEQEPGSGGKESAQATVRQLAGWVINSDRVTGAKLTRWGPLASQARAGNVVLVQPPGGTLWGDDLLRELHNADGSDRVHDDLVSAMAGAFNKLAVVRTMGFA